MEGSPGGWALPAAAGQVLQMEILRLNWGTRYPEAKCMKGERKRKQDWAKAEDEQ